jgi:hypothetical protein
MWLNIQDFKMPNGLAPCFITKYVGLYEIVTKPQPNVYTLKLPTRFVVHLTFHSLKLKLFLNDEKNQTIGKKYDWKLMSLSKGSLTKQKASSKPSIHVCKTNSIWSNIKVTTPKRQSRWNLHIWTTYIIWWPSPNKKGGMNFGVKNTINK